MDFSNSNLANDSDSPRRFPNGHNLQSVLGKQAATKTALTPLGPSVDAQADNALQLAANAHYAAEDLFDRVRQVGGDKAHSQQPTRSGLDGKMQDAAEHSQATLNLLTQLRDYLVGA